MEREQYLIGHDLNASRSIIMVNTPSLIAVIHQHSDSVLVLRIVFSILLAIVFLSGIYIFRIRKRLFDRDPQVAADHYGARNLRLWQVILLWILVVDLLIMALINL
jgi:hypothetical protein